MNSTERWRKWRRLPYFLALSLCAALPFFVDLTLLQGLVVVVVVMLPVLVLDFLVLRPTG